MNKSTLFSFLIMLCVGFFWSVSLIEMHQIIDDISALGRLLYGSGDSSYRLGFYETLKRLHDLEGLLRQARAEQVDTSEFVGWRRLTTKLIDFHDRFTGRCSMFDDHRFRELKRSMLDYKEFGENVASFLEKLARDHYADCETDLRMSVAELLTEEQRQSLHQLNEKMNHALGGKRDGKMTIERAHLIKYYMDGVVFELMKTYGVADRVNYPERGHFSSEFRRLLEEPCLIVTRFQFRIPVKAIDASRVLEFLGPIDSETIGWLEIYETCVGLDGISARSLYLKYFVRARLYDSSYDLEHKFRHR